MKTDITNVSLSFCCKEDWNSFKPIDERTRFCTSCKHRVVDFTSASAQELAEAQLAGQRVCGRFTRSQMSLAFLNSLTAVAIASSVLSCADPAPIKMEPQPIISEEEILMGKMPIVGMLPPPPPGNYRIIRDTTDLESNE